jgi:two-component system, NarL family, sensor histidine kinase DesK
MKSEVSKSIAYEQDPAPFERGLDPVLRKRWRWANLIYLIFVFLPLIFGKSEWLSWALSVVAIVIFLPLHWQSYDDNQAKQIWIVLGIAGLAFALTPWNTGGNTFLIYALIITGWRFATRRALLIGILLIALYVALIVYLNLHWAFIIFISIFGGIMLFSGIVGRMDFQRNAELRLSQEEIKRLARMNERERIARDLHDVLGHTLSVVAIKSELAKKLIDRDTRAAKQQMIEVEQVARQALSQVREAVTGFRAAGLAAEIASARLNLYSAGVSMDVHASALPALPSDTENALALCLRESVTNILRHAQAQRVELELQHTEHSVQMRISDDGRGADIKTGNGLQGLQERVTSLRGKLRIDSAPGAGTRVDIFVPLDNLSSAT